MLISYGNPKDINPGESVLLGSLLKPIGGNSNIIGINRL